MKKIKLALVDDQSLIREGLSMILSLCEDFEIVGEASNGVEAVSLVQEKHPDIVLMDIRMPKMDGVESTKIIKCKYPEIKVIILTTFNENGYIFEGLKNGADGYILKDLKSDEIIKGIKTVYEGNVLLQPEVATKLVKAFAKSADVPHSSNLASLRGQFESLSPREIDISKLVSDGRSNREIGEILFITEGTVKNNITKILAKLQLRDRTQLALFIREQMNGK